MSWGSWLQEVQGKTEHAKTNHLASSETATVKTLPV